MQNFAIYCESESEVIQSCPTLCHPMDCSPPGSSGHGIFQARALEWVPSPSPGDVPLEDIIVGITIDTVDIKVIANTGKSN